MSQRVYDQALRGGLSEAINEAAEQGDYWLIRWNRGPYASQYGPLRSPAYTGLTPMLPDPVPLLNGYLLLPNKNLSDEQISGADKVSASRQEAEQAIAHAIMRCEKSSGFVCADICLSDGAVSIRLVHPDSA